MKRAALSLFLIFWLCAGCVKTPFVPNSTPPGTSLFVEGADFYFRMGSYWIMRDSISGRVDSFVVTYNSDSARNGSDNGVSFAYQQIKMNIWEYNTVHPAASDSQLWQYVSYDSSFSLYCASPKNPAVQFSYNPLFIYPSRDSFFLGSAFNRGADTGVVTNRISSYNVNGVPFGPVAVMAHHADFAAGAGGNPYGYNDEFYVCPRVGIIKMRINHPQDSVNRVWEIQRWSIL